MANLPLHISILGAGNVATHLARQFIKHPDIQLQQMYNRHIHKLKEFESTTEIIDKLEQLKPADIFIIALKDDVIGNVSQRLQTFDNLIVHTSGSVSINALKVKRKGVFYPFQTFSKNKAINNFKTIPVLIEANNTKDISLLKTLGKILSDKVQIVNSEQRKALHIAGVFAANFVNHLYVEGAKILADNNLSFDLIKPLITEVAQKVQTMPPAQAQTGPAVRHDFNIIANHLNFIKDEDQKKIYKTLTDSIIKNHTKS